MIMLLMVLQLQHMRHLPSFWAPTTHAQHKDSSSFIPTLFLEAHSLGIQSPLFQLGLCYRQVYCED